MVIYIFACAADPIFVLAGPAGLALFFAHWAIFAALAGAAWYRLTAVNHSKSLD